MTALWFVCQQPRDAGVAKSGLLLATDVTGWRHLTVADPDGVYQGQSRTRQGARLDSALYHPEPFVVESAAQMIGCLHRRASSSAGASLNPERPRLSAGALSLE